LLPLELTGVEFDFYLGCCLDSYPLSPVGSRQDPPWICYARNQPVKLLAPADEAFQTAEHTLVEPQGGGIEVESLYPNRLGDWFGVASKLVPQ
jgi:hypothetical protein